MCKVHFLGYLLKLNQNAVYATPLPIHRIGSSKATKQNQLLSDNYPD